MSQSRPVLSIFVTNHGFGHAVRAASVAAAIQKLNPEIVLIMVTTSPRWLLENYIPGDFIVRPRGFDVGVIQSDSVNMDLAATLQKLKEIRQKQNYLIASEIDFLRLNRVGLILADIPPLVAPLAKAAGIPCWMMGNFGWDFIYRPWGGEFVAMADWIGECFSQCDRLFRLPLHEPMSAFPQITEVGLTGGDPRYSAAEIREKFALTAPKEKTILLTFGGLGLQGIPYENLSQFSDCQFITFDPQAPDLANLVKVSGNQYRPVDLMPVCGRVISKPGYSTFAEALRLEVPLVSLLREGFAESPLLISGIKNYGLHQIITPAEFFESEWEFLRQDPEPPKTSNVLAKDGSQAIAQAVVDYFQKGEAKNPELT
ncbi:glycosyl transferase [Planktothricoides raciborskii]|uniref:Glycosyl transferase n=1 Tax=Planktothricoides raciborskii FACHB-1370 TaxID=2949576 RepID=A0ABR8EJX9_9CYAN|nr:glycosyl transferase [Planktothricoides raciborskii]MBD2546802.1 glycosyl transferase [Planktothricoides raciborskii FACHB-1370]MBD2583081.1 glycosyl transferase [Planktothricoides raciborskii FACHB-1261]